MPIFDQIMQTLSSPNYKLYVDYFVQNFTLVSFLKFLVLYFFLVWISLIVWVYKDITNRTDSVFYQIISLFLVFIFTPFGVFIYLLIRPSRTITEKYYEEIEENLDILSEAIAHTVVPCPKCQKEVNSHFSYCPHCDFALYSPCKGCGKPLSFDWNSCPHCGKKAKHKAVEEENPLKKEKKESHKTSSHEKKEETHESKNT